MTVVGLAAGTQTRYNGITVICGVVNIGGHFFGTACGLKSTLKDGNSSLK